MPYFDISLTGGTNSSRFNGRLLYGLNSQNTGANTSNVVLYAQILSNNISYSFNGYNNFGQLYAGGGQVASGNYTGTVNTTPQNICSWTGDVSHDVNGNLNLDIQIGVQSGYAGSGSSGPFGWALPRIPLAPSLNTPTSSNVSVVTATISGSAANNGHGTSSTVYLRYKKTSDGAWTELSAGSSKDLTSLTPSTEYQFAMRAVNNNGDDSGWGSTQTFTTLPAPNTSAALLGIVGVL